MSLVNTENKKDSLVNVHAPNYLLPNDLLVALAIAIKLHLNLLCHLQAVTIPASFTRILLLSRTDLQFG